MSRQKSPETAENRQEQQSLSVRKSKALAALLRARTLSEAAQEAGIGASTLRGYLRDPVFVARLEAELDELVQDAGRQARAGIAPGLAIMRDMAENEETPGATRIQAARGLVVDGLRVIERLEERQRIAAMEKMLKELEERR